MPELPEVQTIVDDLNKKILGRKITGVWFDWKKIIKKPRPDNFEREIKGKKIIRVRRKAKNILIDLSDNYLLLVHQKMTGHLLVGKWSIQKAQPSPLARGTQMRPYEYKKEKVVALEPESIVKDPYNRFIHIIFYLDNGRMLALSDMRKFAKIILGKKEDLEDLPELKELGPEPLDKSFKFEDFKKIISGKTVKIKQVLMDQKVISGIGNIYSDDILWLARINPFKPANKLPEKELKNIFKAIRTILQKAIKLKGTSVSDFRDTAGKKGKYGDVRLVYQRKGEKCRRNDGGIIIKKKIGGRSACYCPICQRLQ